MPGSNEYGIKAHPRTLSRLPNGAIRLPTQAGPRRNMRPFLQCGILQLALASQLAGAAELLQPPAIWRDFNPNNGDFKEELVLQQTNKGIYYRESYISAYVLNEEIRVYCKYALKAGLTNAPGLLDVHGWMGAPNINNSYVNDGWAVMAHDYCGNTGDRKYYTKYPDRFRYGNMDAKMGPVIHDSLPDGKPISDPKQTSEYLWYAIERRVLSYLEQQKEVDKNRLGASGYSYGGTLMWALGTDPRVKAIVAHFGIGWIEYYRNKAVWMYNNPYMEPPKTTGEEIFLDSMAPEAYAPYITAATLFLNGSNDHHGGHERGLESFKRFKPGVPWAFAIQARGHHNTEKIEQDCKMWLEKYVLGKDVLWPEHPKSEIKLDAQGVPELIVTPASPDRVQKIEMYYALKNPVSFTRSWRDVPSVRRVNQWIGQMPVLNTDDYVFGWANIWYDTTVVLSTDFNAAIPSKLGKAVATDKPSAVIYSGDGGLGAWSNVAEVEGIGGIKGFRCTSNQAGCGTEKLGDPKWQAPPGSQLGFKFYCTEPQALTLAANDHWLRDIDVTASDNWQQTVIHANRLTNRFDRRPLKDWAGVGKIQFTPKQGSDITKIIFAEFRWAEANSPK